MQQQIIKETFQLVSKRDDNVCNFLEGGSLIGGSDYKLIYRHYATLYFVFCVDSSESELGILDLIQVFVETLDKCFENVCELDLIFHVDKKTLTMDLQPQEISSVTVSELQQLKFSRLSLHEKVTVKKRGRSTPDILISHPSKSNNKKYIGSFNSEWYQRKIWLSGCEVKNTLVYSRVCCVEVMYCGQKMVLEI
uniref:AP complex mu/sigma subunit domain-containing protein n=1 Tax=Timema poppense TaxID=170557 RepID=A0A7R9DQS2_TIMPO|nr:unnamed protein product [Timema poppensis]